MTPGPGSGAEARARLIPWYAEKPAVMCEEYMVFEDDGSEIDLNEPLTFAGTFTVAVKKAQEWVAANDRPVLIVHQASVRVAVVGKEPPQ